MMKGLPIVLLLAVLGGASAVTPGLRRGALYERTLATGGESSQRLRERNESAFAAILGEVRATGADLMFMKTNRYLHAGVGYAPRLHADSPDPRKRFANCDAGVPTVIRSAGTDFRVFLGDLEREVKPYRDASEAHVHTDMGELIPWFRLMTLTNPQYVRGYRVGCSALLDEGKWREAYDFLEEGISNNPENPERFLLFQTLCSYHVRGQYNQDKYPFGGDWAERGLTAAREAYRLGLAQRPPDGKAAKTGPGAFWNEDMEEDFCYTAHMIPLLLDKMGRRGEALAEARKIVETIPGYAPLRRTIGKLEGTEN